MAPVEIKIGIQNVTREVTIEANISAEEVAAQVTEAINSNGVLSLTDDKGRQLLVPAATIGYVDCGPESTRRVGFGAV